MKKNIFLSISCLLIFGISPVSKAATNVGTMTIVKSTYESVLDNSKTCDATTIVSTLCDGQQKCSIVVGNTLCGDPDINQTKELITYYKCSDGNSYSVTTKQFNTQLLSCSQPELLRAHQQKVTVLK